MSENSERSLQYLNQLLGGGASLDQLAEKISPDFQDLPAPLPISSMANEIAIERRWSRLSHVSDVSRRELLDPGTELQAVAGVWKRQVENFIGTVKIPVGLAGPLRVNGLFAKGDYFVPLATTEAALVASYARGCKLLTAAGGCSAMLLNEGVSRSPAFAFPGLAETGRFVAWILGEIETFKEVAASTTAHGRLVEVSTCVEGNHVYLHLCYRTGDASGQNMVTIATDAVCRHILEWSPVKPTVSYVEGNFSGDKKASAQSFVTVRGKKVTAEAKLDRELLQKSLHATPEEMVDYWRMSAMGGVLSGTVGVQGHFANGLAALYLACGQDPACVAESAVGVTRFELTAQGDLYASVTLPGIMVGTVGGGTGLPSQKACLEILGLAGSGCSQALSEVCCGLLLAGELSIIGALAAGHFTRAHRKLARKE